MQPPTGTREPAAATQDRSAQDLPATRQMPAVDEPATAVAPPAPSLVGPRGEGCPNCGSPMAGDQRYCIDCGQRRGEPRLPFMDGRTAAQPQEAPAPAPGAYPPPPSSPRSRLLSSISLIAGIGVLLLAMGVGVLIGNKGDSGGNATAQQPVIIGGGATAATGTTAPTASTGSTDGKSSKAASSSESSGDADKTAKANGVKLAPDDVKLGDKCEKGAAGCEDGEFTGNFFGQ